MPSRFSRRGLGLFRSKADDRNEAHKIDQNVACRKPTRTGAMNQMPLGAEDDFDAKTLAQDDCALLCKVPLEVRLMIWHECGLLDRVIPLSAITTGLMIPNGGPLGKFAGMARGGRVSPHYTAIDRDTAAVNFIGILSSCRRIYIELIERIYTSNTFYLSDTLSFYGFAKQSHPAHLQLLKRLVVNFEYRQPPSRPWEVHLSPGDTHLERLRRSPMYRWRDTWSSLAALKGLTDLTVTIGDRYWHKQKNEEHLYSDAWVWTWSEAELLRDASQILGIPRFRLILSWPPGNDELPVIDGTIERSTENGGAISIQD